MLNTKMPLGYSSSPSSTGHGENLLSIFNGFFKIKSQTLVNNENWMIPNAGNQILHFFIAIDYTKLTFTAMLTIGTNGHNRTLRGRIFSVVHCLKHEQALEN